MGKIGEGMEGGGGIEPQIFDFVCDNGTSTQSHDVQYNDIQNNDTQDNN